MSKYRPPDEWEREIIRRNGMNPDSFTVDHTSDDSIWLLNFKTRDTVVIFKGDRKW